MKGYLFLLANRAPFRNAMFVGNVLFLRVKILYLKYIHIHVLTNLFANHNAKINNLFAVASIRSLSFCWNIPAKCHIAVLACVLRSATYFSFWVWISSSVDEVENCTYDSP